jgi:16S rRNA (guanine527-N7)-methyltransferase
MDEARIAELLMPYLGGASLAPRVLEQVRIHLELLLRWNARVNLTAIREPEQIVTRHFGESFFAAREIKQQPASAFADVGSGAGFPGVPIKLLNPGAQLTLIESQGKKATFLREVIRSLELEKSEVFAGRAEQWQKQADVVTLRAVERFEQVLPIAAERVSQRGTLCVLIGSGQLEAAREVLGGRWQWSQPAAVPASASRVVATARRISIS